MRAFSVELAVLGQQIAQGHSLLAEQAQVQIADGRDAQPVTAGAKVFFIRHDKPHLTLVVRVAEHLRRAVAAAACLALPALLLQLQANHFAGNVMFAKQLAALAGFHQFDKAQLDRPVLDPGEKGAELLVVNVAHQHRVDLDLAETGAEGGINAVHHLAELVLAGNGMKLAGIQAVDADVNRRQTSVTPGGDVARQTVAVGGDRQGTDGRVFPHGGDDLGKIAAQRRLAAGQAHLSVPSSANARLTRRISSSDRKLFGLPLGL